jgi:hypothetical protein
MRLNASAAATVIALALMTVSADTCANQLAEGIANAPGPQSITPSGTAHVNYLSSEQDARAISQQGFASGGVGSMGILSGRQAVTLEDRPLPAHMVFDLGQTRTIREITFNNRPTESRYRDSMASEVQVQVSNDSGKEGFRTLGEWTLNQRDGQRVTVDPVQARYLRVVVTENHGDPSRTRLRAFTVTSAGAQGAPEVRFALPDREPYVNYLSGEQDARALSQQSFASGGVGSMGILSGSQAMTLPDHPLPAHMVFDLGQERTIREITFNNRPTETRYRDSMTRDVEVHVAPAGSPDDFRNIGAWRLELADRQRITIDPVQARYLRVVVTANYGDPSQTRLRAFTVTPGR